MPDTEPSELHEFVSHSGNVIEFGAVNTFGVKELRISSERILLRTTMGGEYEFARDQLRRVKLERPSGFFFGMWFSVERTDGISPDVFFGGHRETIVDALRDRGWTVDTDS